MRSAFPSRPGRRGTRDRGRIVEGRLFLALGFAVVSALLAGGTLRIDGLVQIPGVVSVDGENARVILASLLGAIVTVSVFTFWMRAVMVQLLSRNASVRLTSLFLEDRFQEWLVGSVVGTLTYVTIVLGSIPGSGEAEVPHLSVVLAMGFAMGSVIAILVAIRDAIRSMDLGPARPSPRHGHPRRTRRDIRPPEGIATSTLRRRLRTDALLEKDRMGRQDRRGSAPPCDPRGRRPLSARPTRILRLRQDPPGDGCPGHPMRA